MVECTGTRTTRQRNASLGPVVAASDTVRLKTCPRKADGHGTRRAQQREDLDQIDGRRAQRESSAEAREFSPGSAIPASGLRSEFGEDDVEVSCADWHQSADRKGQVLLCQKIAVDIPDRHDFAAGLRVGDGA